MAAWHTDADLYHQWEEAEGKSAKWEAAAREERERRINEVKAVKAEMQEMMSAFRVEMEKRIDTLTAENAELRAKVAALEEDNARLKSIINNNSSNSSLPPSSDQKGQSRKKSNEYNGRESTAHKRGGQSGHTGKTLTKEDAEALIKSGKAVHRIIKIGDTKRNQGRYISKYEYDVETKVVVTEYRYYENAAGKVNIPAQRRSDVRYGNGLRTIAAALYGVGVVSNERIQEMINALTGNVLKISAGTIYKMIQGVSEAVKPEIQRFCDRLLNQKVLCTDATTASNDGKVNWIRNISCGDTVVYFGTEKKSLESLRTIHPLVKFTGTLVHDHETALYHFGGRNAECNVHLMRYLTKNDEDTGNGWSAKMRNLLSRLNRERKERIAAQTPFSKEEIAEIEAEYDTVLREGKQQNQTTHPKWARRDEASLLRRMEKYKANHLLFLLDFDVPFDNNMSERDLRKCKTRQKMSGGFRSSDGLDMFCRILSFIETAKRRNLCPFSAIHALLDGSPLPEG